jgi:hypothetical protein
MEAFTDSLAKQMSALGVHVREPSDSSEEGRHILTYSEEEL